MHKALRRARRLLRSLGRAVEYEYLAYCRRLPIRPGTILYESFAGSGMLCNPEAIFRSLLTDRDFTDAEHVWVLSGRAARRSAAREFHGVRSVRFVGYRSPAYFRALATSEFLINNATFPPEFGKRPGQTYLNTWHGTPLKKMGYDMPADGAREAANTLRNFVSADYLLSANPFMTTQLYESAYRLRNVFTGLVVEEGYPRIDRQRLDHDDYLVVRDRLERAGIDLRGRHIVLYAPTWKGESFRDPRPDIDALVTAVHAMQAGIGDDYVVLLKTHQAVHRFATTNAALRRVLVPNELPSNLVLGAASMLVTDYSSIFFDFLATGRPIVFYAPDMTDYEGVRGVYRSADSWPGPVCSTLEDASERISALLDRKENVTDRVYQRWREEFTPFEDGEVTRRVVDVVFRGRRDGLRVKALERDSRRTLLMFLGGMRSNGITASALNLLDALDHHRYDVSIVIPRSNKPRARANQAKIPPAVRQFMRFGGMNGSKFDHLRRRAAGRRPRAGLHNTHRRQQRLWDDEWTRCFGAASFDTVIDFSGYSVLWATLMLHAPGAHRAIWLHNDMAAEVHREVRGRKRMKRTLPAIFALYEQYDRLVSVSPQLSILNCTTLSAFAPPGRFVTVRNMIDADRVRSGAHADILALPDHPRDERTGAFVVPGWADRLTRHDGTRWFVTVARLSPEKNQARLLRAFAAVHSENPDTALLIVGGGHLERALTRQVERLGLADSAFLTGAQSNPFAIMATADCFVLSSDYEGQPMVLLEAAALGLPIVAADFESVHDALPNDSIRVVTRSDDGMADGMREFLAGCLAPASLDIPAYVRTVLTEFEAVAVPASPSWKDSA